MTDKHPTRIVGLECTVCGSKKSLKVAESDAELQNNIEYVCKDLEELTGKGCGEMQTHTVDHIYGEPAASRLRELNY